MSRWTIYDKDGNVLHESIEKFDGKGKAVEQDTLEYSGKWMGDCFITVSFKSAYPIDFQIGDYIMYRGEKFTINYDPTVIKKSSRGTYGEGFVYDSIKFNALSNELTDAKFHDWVLSDNKIHYSSLPNFSFYAKDMNDLADRLQACTDRWCKDNGFAKENYWIFYTPGSSGDTNPYDRTIQRAKDISTDSTFIQNVLTRWKQIYGDGGTLVARDDERLDKSISVNNQTVWQGMAMFKSQFGLNFIVRGREVIVGSAGVLSSHIFQYGKNKGLYEVQKQTDTDQKVVTRLHAYGSSDNLPTRYYAELDMKVSASVTDVDKEKDYMRLTLDMPFKPSMYTQKLSKYGDNIYAIRLTLDGTEINARVEGGDDKGKVKIYSEYLEASEDPDDNTDKSIYDAFYNSVKAGSKVYITGGVNKDLAPAGSIDYSMNALPNNMAVMNLMLPGFPKYALSDICKSEYDTNTDTTSYYIRKSKDSSEWVKFHSEQGKHVVRFSSDQYDPYIVSQNADTLGYKDDDIFCTEENDDNGLKKVYPSVEEVTEAEAGVSSSEDYINTIVSADIIKDNGVFSSKTRTTIPGFKVTIKNLGFNLQDAIAAAGGDGCKLSMKDGHCGGRDFDVPSVSKNNDGTWTLNCKRSPDSSLDLYYPYSYNASIGGTPNATESYQICSGDHYVLTGIALEDTNYVWAASVKLLRKAIHWLCKNDYSRYTYSPKIDEIYMARQDEEAKASEGKIKSLHDTLKEGDLLWFKDEDLLLDGKVYIDQLVIKENGNNGIPTYDVTLRNEVQVGTIQRIQNKVDSISNDIRNGNVGGGVNPSTVENIATAVGDTRYLRKDQDDETKHKLTMGEAEVKGDATVGGTAKSTDYTHTGFPFGKGWAATKDDGSGASMLEVDKLFVRMKAYFAELEIRKISYVGGNYVFSSAGGTIYYVEWLDANDKVIEKTEENEYLIAKFRCYLYTDDGTTKTMNWFKEDDQVRCQNFGDLTKAAKTAETTNGVITKADCTTHYWWRRVSGVGSGVITAKGDKKNYEYVDFLNKKGDYGAGSDYPEEGDVMVQFGNWTTAERQGVIMIVVTGDDAPAIIEWQNVGANNQHFTIPDKAYTRISPRGEGNIFRGKFISISGTATDHTGTSIDEQINALIEQLNDIKNQADKKFDIWFNGGEPHPNSADDKTTNAPASDWTTDAEKGLHAQDLYYDTDKDPASNGGRAWRWMAHNTDGNVAYYWDKVTDADTIAALDKARDVQNQVNDIASDGIISHGSEKSQLLIEWNKALANYQKYSALAETYALTSQTEWYTYHANFFNLAVMLNGGRSYTDDNVKSGTTPSWLSDDLGKDTVVDASTYRSTWKAYNDAFAALLKSLSDKTKDLVDAAQESADKKVQTFVSTPEPPYKKGDLWIQTDQNNNVLICISGSTGSYSPYDWTDLSNLVSSTDVRTILATLADKVYALVWDDYLGKSTIRYVDVYIGSQPSSSVYDYDLSYYNGVLYKRNSSWQEVNGSGFESTFATVMSILGTIKIRVSNYTNIASPKQYDLALTQISIKDPVDGNETMGTCEIEMYNEDGAWEVLRTCTLAILKSYGDHIVSVVKGIQGDVSEISGNYVTKDRFSEFSQQIKFDKDGNVVNIKKSGLLTTADGNLLYAMSQGNTVNMLMGTTTGVGWTKETTCAKSDYTFNADKREFTIINYYPKFRDGFKESSYAILKSPIVRIIRGQKYIVSFRPLSIGDGVNFNVCLRYGTATECVVNGDTEYFAWSNKIDESAGKRDYVIIRSSSDPNRYYVIFEASSNYDYMQVLFINAIADGDATSSTTWSDTTYINSSWPYPERKEYHMGTDTVTVSDDGATRTTVAKYAIYTGTDTKYGTVIRTTVEHVVSRNLQVAYLQLEQALYDDISKIIPSPYKESQNAIESYIRQTVDSIRIKANTVVINDKFWVDSNGDVHMNNAHLAGVLSSGSGVKQITIGGNDQNGEINVGGYITLHYDANIEGDKIYGVSVNGSGGVITVKGTPANIAYLDYQPTQITGYSVYSMGAYFHGLMVSKDGIDMIRGSLRLNSISSGSVAISNDSDGYIKGARFKTETLNTSKSYAYETDVRNIICTNTSAITIQLPSSPVLGDELIIIQEGAKIDFISPSIKFKYSNRDIGTTANSDSTGQLNYFLFDGTYWHVRYIKVGRPW